MDILNVIYVASCAHSQHMNMIQQQHFGGYLVVAFVACGFGSITCCTNLKMYERDIYITIPRYASLAKRRLITARYLLFSGYF